MKRLLTTLILLSAPAALFAQVNVGEQKPDANQPFSVTTVTTMNLPWRIAFLPDSRMLITEKPGALFVVTPTGEKTKVDNTPPVYYQGQNGMLGVFLSPHYASDHLIYLTYVAPGDATTYGTPTSATPPRSFGGGLALARAKLTLTDTTAALDNFEVIWRQLPTGAGGQEGAVVAFAPDGKSLFLSVGDRQRMAPAQDPSQPVGKILHLTLDGKPAADNPNFGKTGDATLTLINPPADTEAAKTARVVSNYTLTGPNLTPAETWAMGVRTPYGLAFSPKGELWEVEHGPRGGDELNLIEKGKNYGWPLVSYGVNYNGVPVPSPDSRPDLTKPVIYWAPVIAPGNLFFYTGKKTFPQWDGNGFVTGLATMSLSRFIFDGHGGVKPAERWDLGKRIRDAEEAPDGSLWLIEDANPGAVMHLTPKP